MPTLWVNPTSTGRHLEDNDERRTQITRAIDRNGFDWQVWAVAASGFFTDSYNLFATNVILPSLAFVYWPNATDSSNESIINILTLLGSLLGQLLFGYLADRYGRRRLYGLELIIVIVATIGVAQSSQGFTPRPGGDSSMDILGWILFWRMLVGLGIGAEYPLSAVITAEFAPVQQRARMMSAVFLMQPLGQLAACLVGLGAVMGIGHTYGLDKTPAPSQEDAAVAVDRIWRVVLGVGAVPALVAIIFRVTIPEAPRFTLDVEHDADRALEDTRIYYEKSQEWGRSLTDGPSRDIEMEGQPEMAQIGHEDNEDDFAWGAPVEEVSLDGPSRQNSDSTSPGARKQAFGSQFTRAKLKEYFITEGNWRYLAGTASCWFFLDFAFYGLGINNPRTIAGIWANRRVNSTVAAAGVPDWNPDVNVPNATIYEVLVQDAKQSALTISIGSVVGSLVLLKAIDYVPRKTFLGWSFIALAALLLVTGASFFSVFRTDQHAVTIVFYAFSQFIFNLGPNTLTFIIPAEIFPTRYRCTCHGISAASGKLGSIIIQIILLYGSFSGISISDPRSNKLGIILLIFSALMALGSIFAWVWLPDVQEPMRAKGLKLPSKTLEELAKGRAGRVEQQPATRERQASGGSEIAVGRKGFKRLLRWQRKPPLVT